MLLLSCGRSPTGRVEGHGGSSRTPREATPPSSHSARAIPSARSEKQTTLERVGGIAGRALVSVLQRAVQREDPDGKKHRVRLHESVSPCRQNSDRRETYPATPPC